MVVAARNPARPVIAAAGGIAIQIGARGTLVLDGLVIAGGALRLAATADDALRTLVLRDCTLVPGLTLAPDGSASAPGSPSLVVEHPFARVMLERCITGPIIATGDAEVVLDDCIVDAGTAEAVAFADAGGGSGASLTVRGSTLVGKVHARTIPLASNSLFFARLGAAPAETWTHPLIVERRQQGCIRFCYVPAGAVTPPCYHCVPDAAHPDVQPHFTSIRYGDAAYGQLRRVTDPAIREGADDGGEMGVLHALLQPQREANLRIRLEEYLRFGLHAGLIYAT